MASIYLGTFNAYNTSYGSYNAYFQYDSVGRWQRTITYYNARIYGERIGTGYTGNRGATSGNIGSYSWYNGQLWSGNSPASFTYGLGNVSVGGYASWTNSVGVNVQCRGASASNWDTIYGTVQLNNTFGVECPTAGAPTFGVSVINIGTSSARLSMSITNNPSGFWAIHWYNPTTGAWINYSGYGNTGTWTYDMTGLSPGTAYNAKYQIVGADDTEAQGVVNVPFSTLQNSAVTNAQITDIQTTTNSTTLTINDFKSTERTIFEVFSKDGIDIPISNIQQGVYLYANGVFAALADYCCTINKIDVTPGTTIGILTDFDIGTDSGFNFYNNDTFISGTLSGSLVATVPAGANKCHINFNGTGTPADVTNAKLVTSGITPVRYIRVYQNGSTANKENHLCQIEAYDRFGINRALGKTITGHYMDGTQVTISNPNEATLSSLTNTYAGCDYNQRCYFQLDLGAEYDLKDVKVWRYYPDQRIYYETAIWGYDASGNNTAIWHEYSWHGLYQEVDTRGGVPLLIKKIRGLLPNKEYIIKSKSKTTASTTWSAVCHKRFLTKPETVSVSNEQVTNIGEIEATLEAQSSNNQVTDNIRYQVLSSKNLLNSSMLINNANINSTTGVQESGTRTIPTEFIPVIPSATYTITRPVNSGNMGGRYYDINHNFIGIEPSLNGSYLSVTFTVPNNCYYFKFVDEGNTLNSGYQLEFGNTATSYFPYLSPIGDYTEATTGKNKCDGILEQGSLDNGQPITAATRLRNTNYNLLKASTQYIISNIGANGVAVNQYDANFNLLNNTGWQTLPYTFTSNASAKYYKLQLKIDDSTTIVPANVSNLQVEEGSTATSYEAYAIQSTYSKIVDTLTPLTNYIAVFAIKTSRSDIWSVPKLVSFTTLEAPSAFCKIIYPIDWAYNLLPKNGMATPLSETTYWDAVSTAYYTPLEDGWGRFTFNGSQTNRGANAWIKASAINLSPSTQYTVFVETRNATGILATTGQVGVNKTTLNGMFTTDISQIRGNGVFKFLTTTKASLSNLALRVFADSRALKNPGSIELRIMIMAGDYTSVPLTYHCYDDGSYKPLYVIDIDRVISSVTDRNISFSNFYYIDTPFDFLLEANTTYSIEYDYGAITTDFSAVSMTVGYGNAEMNAEIQSAGLNLSGGHLYLEFTTPADFGSYINKLWVRLLRTSELSNTSADISNIKLHRVSPLKVPKYKVHLIE